MGQKISLEEEDCVEIDDQIGEMQSIPSRNRRSHQFYVSNGDLETVGDLDSILQAISVSQPSPVSQNESPSNQEVIEVGEVQAQQEAIKSVMTARSNKFIRRLSVAYPEQEGDLLSRIRVSTMMKVASYCDVSTQVLLAKVNNYFNSLIRTTRTVVDIKCQNGWVDAINRSPFIKVITLRNECTPEDTRRFCRIIKNDGFPELTDIKLIYVGDDNLHNILCALNTKISRSLRLDIINKDFTAGVVIVSYELPQRVCFAFAEAAQESLHGVLGRLRLLTDDVDGLEAFFKTVDFSSFSRLYEITLSSCPLQRRGFELFIRSMWPEGVSSAVLPPVRVLNLDEVQMHTSGMASMAAVMSRGVFSNLEELNISSNKLSYKGMQMLAVALAGFACPNLRKLNVTDNFISVGYMVSLFEAFTDGCCPLLTELEFGHTGIGAEDLEVFAAYLRTSYAENLTRLNLSNNPQVTAALPKLFRALCEGSATLVKTMLLEGVSLSLLEIKELVCWLLSGKASKLQALVLRSNLLDQESFCLLLCTLIDRRCPRLKVIDFSSNLIGSFDETAWLKLLSGDGDEVLFEQVDYSFNPFTDNDMRILLMFMSRFSRLERTSRFAFAGNNITAETFSYYFRAIPEGPSCLNNILVDSCSLPGVGKYFYEFLGTVAARNLVKLSLRDCNLQKDDIYMLMDALDLGVCNKLTTLKLDGNAEIGDDFIGRFLLTYGEKKSIPNLNRLDAGYTSITADGVNVFLEFFKRNPSTRLQVLDLTSIVLSSAEKELLKGQMTELFCGHCSF